MTIKSDDVVGRVKVYESLIKGKTVNQAGVPESFRVLLKEFQALGLDVQILDTDDNLLELKDVEADDEDENTIRVDELDNLVPKEQEKSEEKIVEETEETTEEDEFEPDLDDLEFPEDDLEEGEM